MQEITTKRYSYAELRAKAELCRVNAFGCDDLSWARSYWLNVAYELEVKAANMPLCRTDGR